MATIDEQLQAMFDRKPKPRPARARKPRARLTPPPSMPPIMVSPEVMANVNRAHTAAMKLIHGRSRGGGVGDGVLLLSYVVWPTEAITEALELAAAS